MQFPYLLHAGFEMLNDVVPTPRYRTCLRVSENGQQHSGMKAGDKLQTRHIHASPYARDNLPIPLDRCDLRMLKRPYVIEARKTAAHSHEREN